MTETVGFEPTYRDKPVNAFRVRRVTASSLHLQNTNPDIIQDNLNFVNDEMTSHADLQVHSISDLHFITSVSTLFPITALTHLSLYTRNASTCPRYASMGTTRCSPLFIQLQLQNAVIYKDFRSHPRRHLVSSAV